MFAANRVPTGMLASRVCPLLSVEPTRGLVDEKLQIFVKNLPPIQEVTLHCLHRSADKDMWEAFGHYMSNEHGSVTVAKDTSVGGTYTGVEPMALMWSLQPVPGSRKGLRLRTRDVLSPMTFHISVYDGHIAQDFNQLTPLVTVVIERWYMAPGVQRVDVHENGVQGTLFIPPANHLPPPSPILCIWGFEPEPFLLLHLLTLTTSDWKGPGPFPCVLDLWGGGGGLVEYRAALLASHGFAAFALLYLTSEEIKQPDSIYFQEAYRILQEHPMVLKDRVALLGLSFGGTVVLTMAATYPVIKPRCCVCISSSHVTFNSLDDFYVELNETHKVRVENDQVIWRNVTLPIPMDPAKKVEVDRIRCPLLLIVGADDQNWAALESAEDIERMIDKAGNRHLLKVLVYPGAGHLIEPPYTPHHRASNFIILGMEKVIMLWGGNSRLHAYAQEDSWEKMLDFLREHLCNAALQARL